MPRLPCCRSLGLGFNAIIDRLIWRTQNHRINRAALEVIERRVALYMFISVVEKDAAGSGQAPGKVVDKDGSLVGDEAR